MSDTVMDAIVETTEEFSSVMQSKWERIRFLDANRVRDGLVRALRYSAEGMVDAALYVKRADELGMNLDSDLGGPMLSLLRRIADGKTLPEVATVYAGTRTLRNKIAGLPAVEQRKLVRPDAAVEVSIIKPDDQLDVVSLPVKALRPQQVEQVFARTGNGETRIRSVEEQNALLRERQQERAFPRNVVRYKILEKEREVLFREDCRLSLAELEGIVRQLKCRR